MAPSRPPERAISSVLGTVRGRLGNRLGKRLGKRVLFYSVPTGNFLFYIAFSMVPDEGFRTPDLLITNQPLYQLS